MAVCVLKVGLMFAGLEWEPLEMAVTMRQDLAMRSLDVSLRQHATYTSASLLRLSKQPVLQKIKFFLSSADHATHL